MSNLNNQTQKLVDEMRSFFFVPFEGDEFVRELSELVPNFSETIRPPAETLIHNVNSILSTVTLPFDLAAASTKQQHHMRFQIAERIRARSVDAEEGESEESLESRRLEIASKSAALRLGEFFESETGINDLIVDVCRFLLNGVHAGQMEESARELLRQGAALAWASLEVLARDVFVAHLNSHPERVHDLLDDPATKTRFGVAKVPINLLAQYGFDLSKEMGKFLLARQDFSDIQTIKAVFGVLYPKNSDLRESLASPELWLLCQRRHLVVHRRGQIDEDFLRNTGSAEQVGSRLSVTPSELESSLKVVRDTGVAILRAVS